jgi:hypothetical protein
LPTALEALLTLGFGSHPFFLPLRLRVLRAKPLPLASCRDSKARNDLGWLRTELPHA